MAMLGGLALLAHAGDARSRFWGTRARATRRKVHEEAADFSSSINAAAAGEEEVSADGGTADPCRSKDCYEKADQVPGYAKLGSGYCDKGFYAGLLSSEALDLAMCVKKCSSESQCRFVSFVLGQTCSRYGSVAGSCLLYAKDIFAAAHTTYAKKVASNATSTSANASRNASREHPAGRAPSAPAEAASTTANATLAPARPAATKPQGAPSHEAASTTVNATPAPARPAAAKPDVVPSHEAQEAAKGGAAAAGLGAAASTAQSEEANAGRNITEAASTTTATTTSTTSTQAKTTTTAATTATTTAMATATITSTTTITTTTKTTATATATTTTAATTTTMTTTTTPAQAANTTTATTSTSTSTRPPPAYLRNPSSLYCWLLARADTFEVKLVRLAFAKNQSVFGCDGHAILADYSFRMGEGVHMVEVGNVTSAPAWWGSVANAAPFINAWDRLVKLGVYWEYSWTVKVDPDSVFLPERLRTHVQKLPSNVPCWVRNWNFKFGLLGPIEVFSALAMHVYSERNSECLKDAAFVQRSGEDGFMAKCFDKILKVRSVTDYGIMETTDKVGNCWKPDGVACRHPFKDPEAYSDCLDASLSVR